ncbi:MAG: hypothetical protein WA095_03875, partial [Minisyncoccia bacterium]
MEMGERATNIFLLKNFAAPPQSPSLPPAIRFPSYFYRQRKIKLPFRQFYFDCGDGGNRIPVQKVFVR